MRENAVDNTREYDAEGEFRKRIQFMYGGKLRKIRFIYKGYSVEAVLDRLPTAKIEKEENGEYTISAEVFGDGIDMWLRIQLEETTSKHHFHHRSDVLMAGFVDR